MKKILIIGLIGVMSYTAILWTVSIIKCEVLTYQHWKEFEGLEESSTNMISKSETVKVLEYSNMSARVYYKNDYGGDILKFVKQDDKWILDEWEKTVWSKMGSADDFIWPYGR